jgi:gliding motility-associated-like protein
MDVFTKLKTVKVIRYFLCMKQFQILALGICLLSYATGFAQLAPTYIGSATSTGGNCYTITTNTGNNSGAAWYNNPIDLSQDFDIVFNAFFGANPNGADGIAFVLKSTSNAVIGNLGEGLGYQNITGNSMAIEFDTFTNTNQGDPGYDHIGVESGGAVNHNLVAPVQASSTSTNIKDNQQHEVKITWRANTHILKVYFDCVERISYNNQIIISVFGGQPTVYFGFTGSTGGSSNQQSVCFKYISFLASSFQDQIICEGDSINNVDGTYVGAASYSWSPTTGVSNPAIANPVFTPTATTTYTLTVTDNCGQTVVRDFTATLADVEVADPIDLEVCGDPAQTHVFNLQDNDAVMKAPLASPDDYEIEYYHNMAEIDNGLPMIWPSNNYTGFDGEIIYAKAVGFSNPCYVVRTFELQINDCAVEMVPYTVHVCEPAPYDGVEMFDLTSYTDEMTVTDPVPATYVYTFYNNQADAEGSNNPITNPTVYPGTSETVWVRADDTALATYGIEELTLIVDPQPVIAPIADVAACDSYTLPAPTVGNYFTQPGGAGTQLNPAVPLTASQTVYVYAVTGTAPYTCTDETNFDVTIFNSPTVPQKPDVQACDSYTLPILTAGAYYTGTGGTGTQLFSGDIITTTQTIYIYAVTGDATTVCEDESDFVVTINSAPVVNPATPLEACADNFDGQAFFDLTQAGAEVINGQTGLTVTYHNTQIAAQNGVNAIGNPSNFYSFVATVYISVIQTGTSTNCRTVVPVQLIVHPRPAIPVMTPYELCDDNTDGVQVFDLTTKDTEATAGDTTLTVSYYTTLANAQAGTNPINPATAFQNTTAGSQTVWVAVTTGFGCRSVASFNLIVNPLPVLSTDPLDFIANECEEVPGQAEFHFDEIALAITDGAAGYTVVFYETLAQAEFGGNDYEVSPYLSGNNFIYARITDGSTGCWTTAQVELRVIPAPIATQPAPIAECDANNDCFAEFNMVPSMQAIETALGNVTVTAHETPEDAEFGVNVIPNPSEYLNINACTQTIYFRVQSSLTECFDIVTLQLIVNPVPEATTPSDYELCDDGASDTDGQSTFNLSTKAAEIYGSIDPALFSLAFYTTPVDAAAATNPIPNPLSYLSITRTVYARVTNNATGCFDVVALNLVVNPLPVLITNQYVYRLCETDAPAEIETFDLTSTIPVFIADQNGVEVTYYHTFVEANAHTNAIANPEAYQNTQPGAETLFVVFTFEATGCYRIGFLDVDVDPEPIILVPTQDELTVCDTNGQGIGEFDLAALVTDMENGEPGLVINFYETQQDALNGTNPIPNTSDYVNSVNPQFIYVGVTNTITGCSNNEPYMLTLIVEPAPQAPALEDLTFCDDTDNNGQDGRKLVDLTVQDAVIEAALGLDIPTQLIVEYYTTAAAAEAGTGRIINPSAFMGTDGQHIWVRVETPVTECYSVEDFFLHFNKPHVLTTPPVFARCNEALPNDGITTFDLTTRDDIILGPSGVSQGYTVNYYVGDPRNGGVLITDPTNYTNPAPPAGNPKTLYVEVITTDGCKSYTTLTVKVLALPVPNFNPTALEICDDTAPTGTEPFDLTDAAGDIQANGSNYILSYYESAADAEAATNAIADPTAYESGSGEVYVRVELDTHNPLEEKCHQVVTLELILNPLPPVTTLDNIAHCLQNSTGNDTFDLQQELNDILIQQGVDPQDFDVDFFTDAALTTPAIPVNAYPVTGGSATVYVRVVNIATGCQVVRQLTLLVEEAAIANPVTTTFLECDYDGVNDGIISTWDLTLADNDILGTQSPADYQVTYYETEADADAGTNAIANPTAYTNTTADSMVIWAVITNTSTQSKCSDKTSFTITVERLPEPVITGGTICVDKATDAVVRPLEISTGLDGATHTFQWFHDNALMEETGASIIAQEEGSYTVIATSTSPAGCVSDLSAPAVVIKSGSAVKVDRGYYVTNYFSDNQTITVTIDGYGVYEYSLDEGPWQSSNIFNNVSPGTHTVRVRDTNPDACEELVITGASIVDYPNFFTPNNDGYHDYWNIIGLQDTGSVIYIFDRYGKLLKQISPDSEGWDGKFNDVQVPSDDYWFTVTYPEFNGTTTVTREFKSHFSLKR